MLTNVQRNLAQVKLQLLQEANAVPQTYVDQLNIALAHINDAAQIIQGVCLQVEPTVASLDTDQLADRQELESLRAQLRERDEQRKQPDEPRVEIGENPASPFLQPDPPNSVLDPNATIEETPADLIPVVDPENATSPIRDQAAAAAENARSLGRQADTEARQSDPPEQGWG